MGAATAMRMLAGLLLLAPLPEASWSQVFEIGSDGAMRAAPGLAPKQPVAQPSRADAVPPPMSPPASAPEWIVQLGAYDSEALREADWRKMLLRHGDLFKERRVVRSEAMIGGHRYFRLAVAGFEDVRAAVAICRTLRAQGRACFVREGLS